MDTQFVFNAIFGVVSLLGGWIFKMAWSRMTNLDDDLEDLQKHHEEDLKQVRKEMSVLALSLPEKYVSKHDLNKLEDFINERFNKLEVKLDQLNKP
tara:strand:- start:238 stop:525 length:288 start_codon:yes stop_codon:yes gene_type:complete